MVVTLKFTLIIFLPLLLIDEANALKCFQCNSKYDRKCANDELIDSKYVVECSDVKHKYENELPATFCMKLYKKYNGHKQVTRSCGHIKQLSFSKTQCQELQRIGSTPSTYCECQTDYCNHSNSQHLKLELVFVIISIYSLIKLIL